MHLGVDTVLLISK